MCGLHCNASRVRRWSNQCAVASCSARNRVIGGVSRLLDTAQAASAAAPATGHVIRTWIGSDRADAGGQSTVTIVWEIVPDTSRVESPDHVGVTVSSKDGELIFRGRSPRDPAAVTPSGHGLDADAGDYLKS